MAEECFTQFDTDAAAGTGDYKVISQSHGCAFLRVLGLMTRGTPDQ